MRKPKIPFLIIITAVFAAFTLGFLLGRNQNRGIISVSVPQEMMTEPTQGTESKVEFEKMSTYTVFPIDINRCGKEELMALPGIGEVLAERILTYRQENGCFSVVEELLKVDGIGKKKLEEIVDLVTIGGL